MPPDASYSAYNSTYFASVAVVPLIAMSEDLEVMLSDEELPRSSLNGKSSAVTAVGAVLSMLSNVKAVRVLGLLPPAGV